MAIRKAGDYLSEFSRVNNTRRRDSDTPSSEKYPSMSNVTPASVDTSASDSTVRGDFNIDDSNAAYTSRFNRQTEQADVMNAKYSDTSGIAQRAIDNAGKNRYTNTEALDERVNAREIYNRDQGTIAFADIFGDLWGNRKPAEWKSAEPSKDPESPDFEKMYDKYNPLEND